MKRLFALMIVGAFLVGLPSSPVIAGGANDWCTDTCKSLQENEPDYFYGKYDNLGGCVSDCRSWCAKDCKEFKEDYPEDFAEEYKNLGECVTQCAGKNVCMHMCKWSQENEPDDFNYNFDSLGDCVSNCRTLKVIECKYLKEMGMLEENGYDNLGDCISDLRPSY